jgi:hypothetical protein
MGTVKTRVPSGGRVQGLKIAVRVLCAFILLAGMMQLVDGVSILLFAGAPVAGIFDDPVLNNQVRFWGAIWFGFGIILWHASNQLEADPVLFRLLCGVLGLSGLARLESAIIFGLPGPMLTTAMAVVLVTAPGFLYWHTAALRRGRE